MGHYLGEMGDDRFAKEVRRKKKERAKLVKALEAHIEAGNLAEVLADIIDGTNYPYSVSDRIRHEKYE